MRFEVFINKKLADTIDLDVQGLGPGSLVIYRAAALRGLLSAKGHVAEEAFFDLVSDTTTFEGCHVANSLIVDSSPALRLTFARETARTRAK